LSSERSQTEPSVGKCCFRKVERGRKQLERSHVQNQLFHSALTLADEHRRTGVRGRSHGGRGRRRTGAAHGVVGEDRLGERRTASARDLDHRRAEVAHEFQLQQKIVVFALTHTTHTHTLCIVDGAVF